MKDKRTLYFYLLLNILISALTTLTVLWIWDRFQLSSVIQNPAVVATAPGESSLIATLPTLSEPVLKIENVFGMGNLDTEVILIKRLGEGELWLTGWLLEDENGHRYTFPKLLLNKDGAVQIYTRTGNDTAISLYWNLPKPVWNSGERVALYDSQHNLRAEYKIP